MHSEPTDNEATLHGIIDRRLRELDMTPEELDNRLGFWPGTIRAYLDEEGDTATSFKTDGTLLWTLETALRFNRGELMGPFQFSDQ